MGIAKRMPVNHDAGPWEGNACVIAVSFIVLGTLNNFAYCVVGAGGPQLASDFNEKSPYGMVGLATVASGFFVRSANSWILNDVSVTLRMMANTSLLAISLFGVAAAYWFIPEDPLDDGTCKGSEKGFWTAIAAIILIGVTSAFGESVLLGYMPRFPEKAVGHWSTGTGIAGVGGVLLYMLLSSTSVFGTSTNCRKPSGLGNQVIFFLLLPTAVIYGAAFFALRQCQSGTGLIRKRNRFE